MMTGLKTLLFGKESRVARRLIVLTIAFSSVITLLISAVQLAFEYRELRNGMERTLDGAGIFVPSLSGSVWNFDDEQIRLALDALKQLPNVDQVVVSTPGEDKRWTSGKDLAAHVETRTYALRQRVRGKDAEIGTLEIAASLDAIYRHVAADALWVVLSNGLKTILVALFMVLLLRRLVTSRLERLARKVSAMSPKSSPAGSAGNVQRTIPPLLDELDAIAWAIDNTSDELKRAEDSLRVLNTELEQRVQKRTAELRSANRELESFSYSVAHDLRAPLRGIDGYTRLLVANHADRLDGQGRQFLQNVRQAAQQMGRLIDDLLAYSQLERRDLRVGNVDPQELIEALLAERADEIEARGVAVTAAVSCAPVTADREGLAMALRNLLENALKFTGRASPAMVEIGGRDTGSSCVISVRDNGIGFDMKYREQIFGMFERLHRSEEYPGTGIGLAMVKKSVERMDGRAWAESTPGKGATFYLEIPR